MAIDTWLNCEKGGLYFLSAVAVAVVIDLTHDGARAILLAWIMHNARDRLHRFFSEARRRRVFSVAAMYIIGAWLLLQVADTLFPAWDIPDQAMQFVVYAVLLGFPIALVFGWRYDISTHGISRTPAVSAAQQDSGLGLRRNDFLVQILDTHQPKY